MIDNATQFNALKQQAAQAVRRGQMEAAEKLWTDVISIAPQDEDALFALGFHAQIKGDTHLAVARFRAAVEYSSPNPLLRLTLAKALKANGDLEGHFVAITAALDSDAYYLPAHFLRAEGLIEAGKTGAATSVYRDVLKIVGPRDNWPRDLTGELEKASAWVSRQAELTKTAYLAAIHALKTQHTDTDWSRIIETADILAGTTRVYHQEPVMLHVPRLPAVPFYQNTDFPWVRALEAASPIIIEEVLASLGQAQDLAVPYVAYEAGVPVNQWVQLNHSKRWSALFFYKNGEKNAQNHALFPKTSSILNALPLANIDGFCPNVMISTLAPRTAIPPHTGETNARLVVHLPLIVPDKCRYRVGNEWRIWEVGKALIFDDSIEHEAINDSDEPRMVLIFDIWNPYLSAGECEAVRALLATRNATLAN